MKKTLELNQGNILAHIELGEYKYAAEYHKKVNQERLKYHDSKTRHNYLRLKDVLVKRGVRFVCVQYPVRNVEPLKQIFKEQTGVIFVDNEMIFKKALERASYKKYFTDFCSDDFGHCTAEGNRILATNIVDVI